MGKSLYTNHTAELAHVQLCLSVSPLWKDTDTFTIDLECNAKYLDYTVICNDQSDIFASDDRIISRVLLTGIEVPPGHTVMYYGTERVRVTVSL